jgi:hypothetical protein
MPHDPNFEYDQAVLEMIERSPVGAVPGTPTHQDALKRLYATYQVYPSADHRDGYVTARSLTAQPGFYAHNLRSAMAGHISGEALESNTSIYNRYIQFLPPGGREKAESLRTRVVERPAHHRAKLVGEVKTITAHDPIHTLFLVPGCGPHPGLPGNYLFGSAAESAAGAGPKAWTVQLHDGADGLARCDVASLPAALAKLLEVVESAPFHMVELEALGFRMV